MKQRLSILFFILLISFSPAASALFVPSPPLRQELPNGMKILFLEDHTAALVKIKIYFPGGSLFDPKTKEGLAEVALNGMRQGGIGKKPAREIEEELDYLGASISIDASEEFGAASLTVLKKNFRPALRIFFGMLREPAFEPAVMEVLKDQLYETLRRELEEPRQLVGKLFPSIIYGKKSDWGRSFSHDSIKKISRGDWEGYHRRWILPSQMITAVSGDLSALELMRELKLATVEWKSHLSEKSAFPKVKRKFKEENFFFPRKGLTQATMMIGHLGESRKNPDKFALIVLNYILGGGSSSSGSRLGEKIRNEKGMAYTIWSNFDFKEEEGIFSIFTQTQQEQAAEVIREIKKIISEISKTPDITNEELDRAKENILRSFYFTFETRHDLVDTLALLKLRGMPDDYIEQYQREIEKMTREELERVAKKYIKPEAFKILVIGDPSIKKRLKKVGRFKRVKL